MTPATDAQLLAQYVSGKSEAAFTELVDRHLGLVYHAALRRTGGDRAMADDISQKVFGDLARKAGTLLERESLAGWLYTSTRYAAAQAVRTDRRRRAREQEAHTMNELCGAPAPDWERIRPILDEAMDELAERDREAVLLRYFENRPLAEVGARLAVSADAARMRIDRALDRLRDGLARRGVASTAVVLAEAFAAQTAVAAPPALAAKVIAAAAKPAAGVSAGTLAGWKAAAVAGAAVGIGGLIYVAGSAGGFGGPRPAPVGSGVGEVSGRKPGVVANMPDDSQSPDAKATGAPVREGAGKQGAEAAGKARAQAGSQRRASATPGLRAEDAGRTDPISLRELSDIQQDLLKRLWDLDRKQPLRERGRFVLAMGVRFREPEVQDALAGLEAVGWVSEMPLRNSIFLSDAGVAFCEANGAAIDQRRPFGGGLGGSDGAGPGNGGG